MTLQGFIESYGYLAVFVGCFLEGETVLVLAGFAAHMGYMSLPWVMATAALAGFCGDQVAFFAGRRYGPRLLAWSPRLAAAQPVILAKLSRHANLVVFMLRFAWGLRIASPIVIGASGLPVSRFAPPNLAGAIVWAIVVGGAGLRLRRGVHDHARAREALRSDRFCRAGRRRLRGDVARQDPARPAESGVHRLPACRHNA